VRLYALAAAIGALGVALLVTAGLLARDSGSVVRYPERESAATGGSDRADQVWGASYFPNTPLVSHRGERVRFFDDLIKDKIVAISFVYTHCANTCPVETARMLEVARLLDDRLGKDVFFYSISIDPVNDTPEVLAEFAERWKIPDGWSFLTGAPEDIVALRKRLGMRLDDVATGSLDDHTVNVLLGNQKTGMWLKRAPFENAHYMASQLGSWLDDFRLADESAPSYAEAPELRPISDGEYVFRNRCAACHTIGEGDLRDLAERHIGPDLYGVTQRRERAWLERWIAEPDVLLAEEDPIALALFEQYDQLPMPNMRLGAEDVASLLGYIDRETQRIATKRSTNAGLTRSELPGVSGSR